MNELEYGDAFAVAGDRIDARYLNGIWHQVGDVLHPGLEADCSECRVQWSPYDDDEAA